LQSSTLNPGRETGENKAWGRHSLERARQQVVLG